MFCIWGVHPMPRCLAGGSIGRFCMHDPRLAGADDDGLLVTPRTFGRSVTRLPPGARWGRVTRVIQVALGPRPRALFGSRSGA
jgi:hypothetical protein